MTYTLAICFGMWLGICGSVVKIDYPSKTECEEARRTVPEKSLGKGYAICAPKGSLKSAI